MSPRFLLDTHVVVRWLTSPPQLSREQIRALRESVRRQQPFGISAMTLLEIAVLFGQGSTRTSAVAAIVLDQIESDPFFQILPLTTDIAREVAALGRHLGDPADRAIVSTARIHNLRLVTSDQRIIDSGLVQVVV